MRYHLLRHLESVKMICKRFKVKNSIEEAYMLVSKVQVGLLLRLSWRNLQFHFLKVMQKKIKADETMVGMRQLQMKIIWFPYICGIISVVTLCHKRVHCTLTSTTLSVHHCLICSRKRRETAIGLIKNRGIAFGIRRIESPRWMVCITLHFSLAFFFTLSYRHIQIPTFKVSSCLEKRKKKMNQLQELS